MLAMDSVGTGYIPENNTTSVEVEKEGCRCFVSVNVPLTSGPTFIRKGTVINRAVLLPDRCVENGVVLRGDLPTPAAAAWGPDTAEGAVQPGKPDDPVSDTNAMYTSRMVLASATDTETDPVTENATMQSCVEPGDAVGVNDEDPFFQEPKWACFRSGGLRMFRPTKADRRDIENLLVFDKQHN